jgi:hypothetical protein
MQAATRGQELTSLEQALLQQALTLSPVAVVMGRGAGPAVSAAFDGDGNVVGTDGNTVRVWTREGKEIAQATGGTGINNVSAAVSAQLIAWTDDKHRVWVWDRAVDASPISHQLTSDVRNVTVAGDGSRLLVEGLSTVQLFTPAGEPGPQRTLPHGVTETAMSSNAKLVAVLSDGDATLWRSHDDTVEQIAAENDLTKIGLSGDGNLMAAYDGVNLMTWNTIDQLQRWSVPWSNLAQLAVDQLGTTVAASDPFAYPPFDRVGGATVHASGPGSLIAPHPSPRHSRDASGRHIRSKVFASTASAARAKLSALRPAHEAGQDVIKRATTFKELVELWLERGLASDTTDNTRQL